MNTIMPSAGSTRALAGWRIGLLTASPAIAAAIEQALSLDSAEWSAVYLRALATG